MDRDVDPSRPRRQRGDRLAARSSMPRSHQVKIGAPAPRHDVAVAGAEDRLDRGRRRPGRRRLADQPPEAQDSSRVSTSKTRRSGCPRTSHGRRPPPQPPTRPRRPPARRRARHGPIAMPQARSGRRVTGAGEPSRHRRRPQYVLDVPPEICTRRPSRRLARPPPGTPAGRPRAPVGRRHRGERAQGRGHGGRVDVESSASRCRRPPRAGARRDGSPSRRSGGR